MRRREFLLGAAGLAWVPVAGAREETRLSFGFSLYGMRSLSLHEAIGACARIGYDAVELPVMPDWPAEPKKLTADSRKQLRRKLADAKLTLPALMENLPLDGDEKSHLTHLERLKQATELAHDLDERNSPLVETILGGKVDAWDQLKTRFRDRLGEWAKWCEKSKSVVAVKPHRLGAMNRPEHALWLLEQVNSKAIRLVYDWSHYEQRDLKMDDTLKALLPLSLFVHVKDTKIVDGKVEFLLPGDGETNYPGLVQGLKKHGYRGCVCVEVSGMIHSKKDYDPLRAAKHCFEKVKPAFGG